METVEEYKNVDLSTLRKMNLNELTKIYQGEDSGLISDIKTLYSSYKELKNNELEECIVKYNNAIDCFLNFNHVFFILYTHPKDEYEKGVAFSYIGSSQVHLTKLQSHYNQLVYRKQQRENKRAMLIARISLYVGIISLIVSIIISMWDKLKMIL